MRTFDGKYYNLLLRQCEYILAQHTEDDTIFTIKLRKRFCSNPMGYCKRDISIEVSGEAAVRLDFDESKNQPLAFFEPSDGFRRPIVSIYQSKNMKIEFMGSHNIFVHATQAGFTLQWTGASAFLTVGTELEGKTQGLCGLYNHDQRDDFHLRNGEEATSIDDFTTNWLYQPDKQLKTCFEPSSGDCFDILRA